MTLEPLWESHGIALALMGMFVVFVALVLVSTFITLLPKLMAILDRLHPEPASPQETRAAAKTVAEDEVPHEILVVIAAAVAETIAVPHRIVHTRQASDDHGWSREGRTQHHTSHGVSRRK